MLGVTSTGRCYILTEPTESGVGFASPGNEPAMNTLASTREHYRLSQEQWARVVGAARSTVSAWESGVAEPPPAVLAAYRKLQELIRRGDHAQIEATREHLLGIVARAEREAERLNRGRLGDSPLVKLVAVSAAAIAIGMLLGYLFRDESD